MVAIALGETLRLNVVAYPPNPCAAAIGFQTGTGAPPDGVQGRRPNLPGSLRRCPGISAHDNASGELLAAVSEIASGGAVMSPEVARRVPELFRKTRPAEQPIARLSPHETRLLKPLTEGHQNKTAAAELGISVHTVSFHLRSVYDRLHVHSRSEGVVRALRDLLID